MILHPETVYRAHAELDGVVGREDEFECFIADRSGGGGMGI